MAVNVKRLYGDRFEPKDDRTRVLFNSNRPLQNAELNEMQSQEIHRNHMTNDSIHKEGERITGMAHIQDGNKVTVEAGRVYVQGQIRRFEEQSVTLSGEGREEIGVIVEQRVVTHEEDPSLLDPSQTANAEDAKGADRLEEKVKIVINDERAANIFRFDEGILFREPSRRGLGTVMEEIARRTYQQSGNYRVKGLGLHSSPSEVSGMVDLIVDSGISYVRGWHIDKTNATRIQVPKALETREVTLESHTYDSSVRTVTVGSNYVDAIDRVIGRAETAASGITLTKGGSNGRDLIPSQYTDIDPDTLSIWTQQSSTNSTRTAEFELSRDYRIVREGNAQYIDWDATANGTEPSQGTTYYLSFQYNRVMSRGTDYSVIEDELDRPGAGVVTKINFNGMPGVKPRNNGTVSVAYTYFLARTDLVVLDELGDINVLTGQSDSLRSVRSPVHEDPNVLKLGNITVYPNSDHSIAESSTVTNYSMEALQKLHRRLENVEYNQATRELENAASRVENPLFLRGVFADAFISTEKYDPGLSSIAFSFEDAQITLRSAAPDSHKRKPAFLGNSSTAHSWGRLVSAPFTERVDARQPYATEAWNVNPYMVFNRQGTLALSPAQDSWIEEEKVTITKDATEVKTIDVDRWWARPNGNISENGAWARENVTLDEGQGWDMRGGEIGWKSWDIANGRTGTAMIDAGTETKESMIDYMRQIDVTLHAKNLLPNENNLYLTFDGVQVDLTPASGFLEGGESGTVRSNSNGEVRASFRIPSNIRTGTREVTLRNQNNMAISTFTAQGIRRDVTSTVLRTRVAINLYDPLAQAFAFPTDRVVSSVGAYFASKSTTGENLVVQIRGLSEGGQPNRTIYAETVLTASQVNISDDASVETKIAFDEPVMTRAGESYCMVFITDSAHYTMWVATMGERFINDTEQMVETQPYPEGVLFSSSNAVTWTPHQRSNLKFNVYTAEFNKDAVLEFSPMTDLDSDGLLLMSNYLTPNNTGCYWEAKVIPENEVDFTSIDSVPWVPIVNYQDMATNVIIGVVQLRATFSSNRYISPLLVLDDILFSSFVTATSGDYVSRNATMEDAPFNEIKVEFQAHTPPGSSVTPKYSVDGGTTWKSFSSAPETKAMSREFTRYSYRVVDGSTAVHEQFRVKLELRAENRFVRPRVSLLTAILNDAINN